MMGDHFWAHCLGIQPVTQQLSLAILIFLKISNLPWVNSFNTNWLFYQREEMSYSTNVLGCTAGTASVSCVYKLTMVNSPSSIKRSSCGR